MRLTRLRALNEVRSTADSPQGESGAKPAWNKSIATAGAHRVGGDGISGSAMHMNQGTLSVCRKEADRTQSPHSSDEAGNDRGAKEGRKWKA